jgi:hypothetical protein
MSKRHPGDTQVANELSCVRNHLGVGGLVVNLLSACRGGGKHSLVGMSTITVGEESQHS